MEYCGSIQCEKLMRIWPLLCSAAARNQDSGNSGTKRGSRMAPCELATASGEHNTPDTQRIRRTLAGCGTMNSSVQKGLSLETGAYHECEVMAEPIMPELRR